MKTSAPETRQYRFSGHQTFALRYGWLEKGVRGVCQSPTVFHDEDALVRLGVGKNMVQSIKHWCTVTQLIEPSSSEGSSKHRAFQPSSIAKLLLLDTGWDSFLEDDASLWLIHWLLVSHPTIGTTWQVLFSLYHRPDFTRRELVDHMQAFVEKRSLRVGEASLARDVDCFLRTYIPSRTGTDESLPEETFACPLIALGLMQHSPDGELFSFAIGAKPSLPALVVGFAINQYFRQVRASHSTMSVSQCLYGPDSPGQVFKLDENSLIEYTEELEYLTDGAMVLDETAGLKTIYRRRDVDDAELLSRYYATAAI